MHPAEQLWVRHEGVRPYPPGVLPVPNPIRGTAFFPGGFGLWNPSSSVPLPPFPFGGVMVLGQDFHSESGYHASLKRGYESPSQPTWYWLTRFLEQSRISLERCFFTNVFMGLRAGDQTTGPFPGSRDPSFVERCRKFLAAQIAVQQPVVILTLGVHAPRILASLSPQLGQWATSNGLKFLDRVGPVQMGVGFVDALGVQAAVVALTHPSFRFAAVRHRRYKGFNGNQAELEMVREVSQLCTA